MPLIDPFKREINYLRISVTDRCDFRCQYCMAEDMQFVPRQQVLSLEEMLAIGRAFVGLGGTKLRITGGEPLIRRNLLWLLERLAALPGLKELCLTTNGSHLSQQAEALYNAGVSRINVSLDSLKPERFGALTRYGKLDQVLAGLQQAKQFYDNLKINAVILKGRNDDEILPLTRYAVQQGFDISFIEEMPLGQITSHDRARLFCSSGEIKAQLQSHYELLPSTANTGGPSRYYQLLGTATRVGFISPHSHNFCASCNRVRLTAEGRLLLCLGNEHSLDLRALMRANYWPSDTEQQQQILSNALIEALALKPREHEFSLTDDVKILRFMNTTGG